jgi:hypothetical protein
MGGSHIIPPPPGDRCSAVEVSREACVASGACRLCDARWCCHRSCVDQKRVDLASSRDGGLLPERPFLVRERGSLEFKRRWASSALSAATWRERSSMCCRSAFLSGIGAMLASMGWVATSMMRSPQWAAAFKFPSGWPARTALTLEGSWLDQILRRKSSGTSGTMILRCLRKWDGLRSHFSSVRS